MVLPAAATSAPPGCKNRNNNTYAKLLDCVTLEGVRAHQAAFQAIADANDDEFYPGTRAAGTEGYDGSVDYVAGLLEDAGYDVTLDAFEFAVQFPAILHQLTPVNADVRRPARSPAARFGDVTGAVIAVDINLAPPRANTSGCEADADFAGARLRAARQRHRAGPARDLHVRRQGAERPDCRRRGRHHLQPGQHARPREGLHRRHARRSAASDVTIPVVGASFADGEALAQPGSTAHVRRARVETRTDVNVIAELPGDNTNNVVMAGAHLDSVEAGPGHQRQRLRLGGAARDRSA